MTSIKPSVLRELLDYDPDSGKLFWKPRPERYFQGRKRPASVLARIWNSKNAGNEALCSSDDHGYRSGRVFKTSVKAHRIAWSIFYGKACPEFIDHINGIRSDNRIVNLRAATRAQNNTNKAKQTGSLSRYIGVFRDSPASGRKGWRVQIKPSGRKLVYVGRYYCELEAAKAYDEAAKKYHGEFARLNFPNEESS